MQFLRLNIAGEGISTFKTLLIHFYFALIGFLLVPLVAIFHIVCTILTALAANRGEMYVYPVLGWFLEKLNVEA